MLSNIKSKITNVNTYLITSVFLSVISMFANVYFHFSFSKFFLFIGLAIICFNIFKNGLNYYVKNNKIGIVFLFSQGISIIIGNFQLSNISTMAYLSVQFFLFAFKRNVIKDEVEIMERMNCVFILLVSLFGIISILLYLLKAEFAFTTRLGNIVMIGVRDGELMGIFGSQIDYGFCSALASAFSLYFLCIKKNNNFKVNIIFGTLFLINFAGLILSGSRGALILFILILFSYLIILALTKLNIMKEIMKWMQNHTKAIIIFSSVIFTVSTCTISISLAKTYQCTMSAISTQEDIKKYDTNYGFTTGRVDLWQYGASAYLEKPVLGHGLGYAGHVVKSFDIYNKYYISPEALTTHNLYLYIAAGGGTLGLFIFYYYFVDLLVYGFLTIMHANSIDKKTVIFIYSVLLSFLATGFIDAIMFIPFYYMSIIFFSYIGFMKSYIKINN